MIYTEITPNPASLKFVITQTTLMPYGTADFRSVDETADAPIARKLFNFAFVEGVFLGRNFITITKAESFQWEEVIPAVKDFIKTYLESGQPLLDARLLQAPAPTESGSDSEVVTRIKALLESHIRPAVAQDGGDVAYHDFVEGVVQLRMHGSCSGCPSSTFTLKAGIENLLKHHIAEVKTVEAV